MIINAGPQMGYSELVELYGEELGFSIGKTLRKAKGAVKSVAKVVAKPVVKAAGVVKRNAGNIAVVATAVPTGGLSLLAKKSVRNAVGTAARATQSAVLRPTAGIVASVGRTAARSPMVQKVAANAIKSFVPGGAAAFSALDTARALAAKGKKAAPMAAKKILLPAPPPGTKPRSSYRPQPPKPKPPVQRSARGQVGQARGPRPSSAPAAPAPVAESAPAASSFPMIPVAIGGAGLLLVLAMSMGKKK